MWRDQINKKFETVIVPSRGKKKERKRNSRIPFTKMRLWKGKQNNHAHVSFRLLPPLHVYGPLGNARWLRKTLRVDSMKTWKERKIQSKRLKERDELQSGNSNPSSRAPPVRSFYRHNPDNINSPYINTRKLWRKKKKRGG
jgi:hypothetical protein